MLAKISYRVVYGENEKLHRDGVSYFDSIAMLRGPFQKDQATTTAQYLATSRPSTSRSCRAALSLRSDLRNGLTGGATTEVKSRLRRGLKRRSERGTNRRHGNEKENYRQRGLRAKYRRLAVLFFGLVSRTQIPERSSQIKQSQSQATQDAGSGTR